MRAVLTSLGAFVASAAKPRSPLARAIVAVLAIKLVAIVAIKVFLFPGDAQPVVNEAVMTRLLGASTPVAHEPGAMNSAQ